MPRFLNLKELISEFGSHLASIFTEHEVADTFEKGIQGLFRQDGWSVVGLPRDIQRAQPDRALVMKEEDPEESDLKLAWPALFETLRAFGENELTIAARPHVYSPGVTTAFAAAVCKFDRREFMKAESEAHFWVHQSCLVFGRRPIWGMVGHWESFSILGGNPDFIGAYVQSAGGIGAVRRRFAAQLDFQFRTKEGDTLTDRFADRLARSIHWPE